MVGLANMYSDRVTLVKADGSVSRENLCAVVMKGKIQLHDGTLPIETGDHLLRKIPNGMVEDYKVTDTTLHSGLGITYYEVDVVKSTTAAQPTQAAIQHITNVFHGHSSRVNISSIDNSVNVASSVDIEAIRDFVGQVRAANGSLPEAQRQQITELLAKLEATIHSPISEPSKIADTLRSIKTVAEGAAGNLVASGIATMAGSFLGG